MKLILEKSIILDSSVEELLNESTGKVERNYYISGIFSTPDVKNRNGREYPRSIWEREVKNYQIEINTPTVNSLVEYNHPPRSTVDPESAVARIVELKFDDNGNVWGKAKILNDNTDKTNRLKGLIKEGIKIGISSRGVGTVSDAGIVEEYKLITYDIVDMPSDYNAMLNGVVEGYQITEGIVQGKEFEILENGCIGECSLSANASNILNESEQEDVTEGMSVIGARFMQYISESDIDSAGYLEQVTEELNDLLESREITINEFNFISQNLNEIELYENVSVLKYLLNEINAEKLCDLNINEKEEILTKFAENAVLFSKYKESLKEVEVEPEVSSEHLTVEESEEVEDSSVSKLDIVENEAFENLLIRFKQI